MVILELNLVDKTLLEKHLKQESIEYEVIESKKLGGEEIIFQVVISAVEIAAPYIINFFKNPDKDKEYITLIKDGVKIKFENEAELRKFLEANSGTKND